MMCLLTLRLSFLHLSFVFITTFSNTSYFFFFFNDTPTTEIYTLSLHDALPISRARSCTCPTRYPPSRTPLSDGCSMWRTRDRKSTRLNSSHQIISYAVFCLKKKKIKDNDYEMA